VADEDTERIASGYRAFAEEAATESPLYSRLASAVADDGDVLRFLAGLPEAKRQPALLFAAVQFLHGTPADPAGLRGVVTRAARGWRPPCGRVPPRPTSPRAAPPSSRC
jgi:hypothetical protein